MKVAKVVSYFIIALILVGIIAGLVMFLDNGQSNYYVCYGDKQISQNQSDFELQKKAYSVFYPKSVLSLDKNVSVDDYNVAVRLVKENVSNVTFTVGNISKNLYDDIDFSTAFMLSKYDGYFVLYVQELTITEILQAVYPAEQLKITDNLTLWESDCFQIEVTFLSEDKTVTISFH